MEGGATPLQSCMKKKELDWMLDAVELTIDNARTTGALNRIIEEEIN